MIGDVLGPIPDDFLHFSSHSRFALLGTPPQRGGLCAALGIGQVALPSMIPVALLASKSAAKKPLFSKLFLAPLLDSPFSDFGSKNDQNVAKKHQF
jgi:hypothetical protein